MSGNKSSGRRTELTPAVQELICRAIESGSTKNDAAQFAGIGYSTFFSWVSKGEKAKSGIYKEFVEALARSEAKCRVMMVNTIAKAANDGDWRAALEYLKRRDRANWGDQVAVTGADGGPLLIGFSEDVGKL